MDGLFRCEWGVSVCDACACVCNASRPLYLGSNMFCEFCVVGVLLANSADGFHNVFNIFGVLYMQG